jgi:2-polyprenyl-3-methyl-5-hydroxy-6-metoxy-1,4-benzoquinol methylase
MSRLKKYKSPDISRLNNYKYKDYDSNYIEEAKAFDSQIIKRVKGGHIPDLDNLENCDYFYNNPWRRKYFAELDFGEQRDLIINVLNKNIENEGQKIRILEIGSGPGHMSLAFARAGYIVTGLDLSYDCISVALDTANKFSPELLGSKLEYVCDNIFNFAKQGNKIFDAIVFVGAMHHFTDQTELHLTCKKLLKREGLLICHEPVRDKISKRNAIANVLITSLLSISGNYYKEINKNFDSTINKNISKKFKELRYELEDGEKAQSVNDNEAGYNEMYPILIKNYKTITFEWKYGIFHEIIGGLRLSSAQDEAKLAKFIRDIDRLMCQENMIDPSEFFFVGKNSI